MHRRERSTGGSNTNASASAASNTASNSNSSPGNTSPTKRQLGPSSSVPLSPSKYGSLPRSFTRAVARVSSGIGAAEVRDGTAVGSGPTAKSSDSLSGALMGAFKASAGRQTDSGVVILGPFAESGFDVADYLTQLLAGASEETIRQFHRNLSIAGDQAAVDIQRNVHKNYTQFILISKEIAQIEADTSVLREIFSELRAICDGMLTDVGIVETVHGDARVVQHARSNDSSLDAGSRVLRGTGDDLSPLSPGFFSFRGVGDDRNDLPALKENIDGLSKLLPKDETKQLLREGGGLFEVFTGSQSESHLARGVFLFLLNDTLIVARRKRRVYGREKLVADKVCALADLGLIDMKDAPPDIVNSFRLVINAEPMTYRAESADVKRQWVAAIKAATDDVLRTRKQKTGVAVNDSGKKASTVDAGASADSNAADTLREAFADITDTVLNSGRTSYSAATTSAMAITSLIRDENINPDLAWIKDMPDELDVYIAHREFDKAVQCIERAKSVFQQYGATDPARHQLLRSQMDTRLQQLATFISRDLSNPHLPRSHIRTNVQRLIRLGMGEHARDTFLAARSSLIRQRVKQLAFEGDTMQYINELSFIVFTLLKHSCAWFVASFKEPRMSSGFIKWLKGELENYATIFRCQVFHDGQQFATIADCMASTVYHCQTLADVGLDVGFLFGQNFFHRDVAQSIELHRTRMLGAVSKAIADDEFTSLIVTEEFDGGLSTTRTSTLAPATTAGLSAIPSYYATPSCAMFKSTVLTFLTDLAPLVTNALYTETVESVQNFFETYFRHMMDLSHAQHMDRQRLLLVVNVTYLSMHVFPCLRSVLSSEPLSQTAGQAATLSAASKTKHIHRFGRPIPELDKLQVRLASMRAIILQAFHQRRATKLAVDTFAFGPVCLGDKARSTPAPAATATALPSASPTSPSKRVGGKFGTTVAPTYGTGNWMDYSSDIYPISEQSFPSDNMLRFIKELHGLALLVDDVTAEFKGVPEKLLPIDKKTVVQGVLEAFFADITEDANWTSEAGHERPFGYTGVQQFVLDIHTLLQVCHDYLQPAVTKAANDACARALKLYFSRARDATRILKTGEWYDRRVEETINKGGGQELKAFGTRPLVASPVVTSPTTAPVPPPKVTAISSSGVLSAKRSNDQLSKK